MADSDFTLVKDMRGHVFGRLTVLERAGSGPQRNALWHCVCSCGSQTVVSGIRLRNGHTTSCGCAQRDSVRSRNYIHGKTSTPTYAAWEAMNRRCHNKSHPAWHRYGGRGINICSRRKSFSNFLSDMGEKPAGLTLERLDRNGNYEPSNCVWASQLVQSNNTSRNVYITYEDTTRSLADWARYLGLNYKCLYRRYKLGDTPPNLFRPSRRTAAR